MTPPGPALREYEARSGPMSVFQGWVALLGAVLLLFGLLPHDLADQVAIEGVIALGAIGLWRWGWGGVHLLRAYLYRRLVFPRLRAEAETVRLPPAVYVIVTSYRIEPDMNAAVYRRLLAGVAAMGVPARIVACVTDPADAQVLGAAFTATADLPEGTTLDLLVQDGTGKRAAMADALALVMRLRPPPHAQLVLMDGDTLLNPGDLSRSCRFLAAYADVGAVTTDNRPLVKGSVLTREWYRLRMAQRDVLMSSMALSGRVLVLTGRFSVMRMEVARLPDFAQAVAHDSIVHWRLGPIQMLTGDDKSSWFVVLKAGWKMLYLPDVRVDCAEELPPGGWWRSTSALMLRWYGNMARNNGRSLALGPRRIGWFTWLCLLDQRIAPWTTLAGPVVMLKASFFYGTGILVAYALWVLGTRSLICVGEFLLNRRFHPLFPFLLYQTQLIGAVIKIITLHAPDRQRWTRQKLAGRAQGGLRGALSLGYTGLSFGLFLLAVIALSARLDPDASPGAPVGLEALVVRPPTPDDHLRLPCGWSGAAPCAAVLSGPPRPLPRPQ